MTAIKMRDTSKRAHRPMRTPVRLGAALLLMASAVGGFVLPSQPALAEPGAFFDGQVKYSTILECFSIIQGAPYTEKGAGAWVGVYTDTDGEPDGTAPIPSVNQAVYMHVVVYGLGNSCSGQRFVPAFDLPANVSFDTSYPILCFTASGQATSLSDCPQWGNVSSFPYESGAQGYYSTDGANANTWPLPQGAFWEFRFPVKSTTLQTNSTLRGYVKMFDGNDSPVLNPTSPMYVFGPGAPPAVMYDTPSTFASPRLPAPYEATPTAYGILSEGTVVTQGLPGTVYIDRTKANSATWDGPSTITVDGSSNSWLVWTDWDDPANFDALAPDSTYKWRLGFDPDPPGPGGGGLLYGSEKTFRSLASPTCHGRRVTVGLQFGQFPTSGNDVIMGTSGADSIDGDAGNDTICALGGNDTIIGGSGNDLIDGGGGTDTVSYTGTSAAVTVSLTKSTSQNTGGAGTDTITNVENLTGGNGNDRLTGSSARNALSGGKGNDVLRGSAGNDTIIGGAGNDTIIGGDGTDTVSYTGTSAAVTVSLAKSTAQNTGGAGTDTITGTENLTGGKGADRLVGSSGRNTLNGGPGHDRCNGLAGRDVGVSCEIRAGIP